MKTAMDKAGRIIIPAPIREKAGLKPGEELEVRLEEAGIRLVRAVPGPRLVRVGGRLVARPTAAAESLPAIDVAALVDEERDRWP